MRKERRTWYRCRRRWGRWWSSKIWPKLLVNESRGLNTGLVCVWPRRRKTSLKPNYGCSHSPVTGPYLAGVCCLVLSGVKERSPPPRVWASETRGEKGWPIDCRRERHHWHLAGNERGRWQDGKEERWGERVGGRKGWEVWMMERREKREERGLTRGRVVADSWVGHRFYDC